MTLVKQETVKTLNELHSLVAEELSEGIKSKDPMTRVKYCGLARIFLKHNGIKADPHQNAALSSLCSDLNEETFDIEEVPYLNLLDDS